MLNNPLRFAALSSMLGGLNVQALNREADHFHPALRGLGEGVIIYSVAINSGACLLCTRSECQMKDPDLSCLAFKTL